MTEPTWLSEPLVIAIHDAQLAEHGGAGGVRDAGLLASALARPLQSWSYGDPPPHMAALAAAYAYGIARNHPFVDGNKRTALVACETFLNLNGCELTASNAECVQEMLLLAEGSLDEAALAAWLERNLRPSG